MMGSTVDGWLTKRSGSYGGQEEKHTRRLLQLQPAHRSEASRLTMESRMRFRSGGEASIPCPIGAGRPGVKGPAKTLNSHDSVQPRYAES